MEDNEWGEHDLESSEQEMKSVAYTAVSLLGGLIILGAGVGLLAMFY